MAYFQTREMTEASGGEQRVTQGGEGERISISPSRFLFGPNEKSSLLNHKAIKKLKIP